MTDDDFRHCDYFKSPTHVRSGEQWRVFTVHTPKTCREFAREHIRQLERALASQAENMAYLQAICSNVHGLLNWLDHPERLEEVRAKMLDGKRLDLRDAIIACGGPGSKEYAEHARQRQAIQLMEVQRIGLLDPESYRK